MVLRAGEQVLALLLPCCNILSELRVRAATQNYDVANHDESGGVCQSSLKRARG